MPTTGWTEVPESTCTRSCTSSPTSGAPTILAGRCTSQTRRPSRCPTAPRCPWWPATFSRSTTARRVRSQGPWDVSTGARIHPDTRSIAGSMCVSGQWSAVVTCFFIDTARNVVDYVKLIRRLLRPGGVWLNLGRGPAIMRSLRPPDGVVTCLARATECFGWLQAPCCTTTRRWTASRPSSCRTPSCGTSSRRSASTLRCGASRHVRAWPVAGALTRPWHLPARTHTFRTRAAATVHTLPTRGPCTMSSTTASFSVPPFGSSGAPAAPVYSTS